LFEKLFISRRVDIVLGADVLLKTGALAQHDGRVESPGFGEHLGIDHRHFVVDLVLVHARIAFGDM